MIEETGAADRVLFSKAEKWVLSIAEQRLSLDITCHHLRVLLTCSVMAYPSFVLVASKNSWGECYIAPSTSMCTHFNSCRNTKTTASHLGLLIGTLSNIGEWANLRKGVLMKGLRCWWIYYYDRGIEEASWRFMPKDIGEKEETSSMAHHHACLVSSIIVDDAPSQQQPQPQWHRTTSLPFVSLYFDVFLL